MTLNNNLSKQQHLFTVFRGFYWNILLKSAFSFTAHKLKNEPVSLSVAVELE